LSTNLILLILDYLQPEEREGLKNGLLRIIDLLLYQTVMLANRYSVLTITSKDRNENEKQNVTVEDKQFLSHFRPKFRGSNVRNTKQGRCQTQRDI
jgi:hypothetical protein